jgi:hypothetical protein
MLDMSEIVNDPDLAQPFQIIRKSGGTYTAGVWSEISTTITSSAVISVAKSTDLLQLPEADRIAGTMVFHSTQPIYETSQTRGATSDILIWRGDKYRVSNAFPYDDYSYVKVFAVRMQGS